jgi:biopolymer transport protein ExbB
MYPILGLASFAFIVAIFKWFEIGGVKRARPQDIKVILEHLKKGDKDQAMAKASSVKGPVGEMLKAAVEYSDNDLELLEEILYEKIITTQPMLERMLPLVAVTAATAPLLGLLGTVTGMIKTFKLITVFGTGDASNLATGISEALITTEFGLIIAIPSLILHAILSRKAKGVISSMEQAAVAFLNGVTEFKKSQAA